MFTCLKLNFAQSFFSQANSIHHSLELLGFQRKSAIRTRNAAGQGEVLFNYTGTKSDGCHRNGNPNV